MYTKILATAAKYGIPAKQLTDFFQTISSGKAVDNALIIQKTGLAKSTIAIVKKEFRFWFEPQTTTTKLNSKGMHRVRNIIKDKKTDENNLPQLDSSQINKFVEILTKNNDQRVKPKRQYDQFNATIDTTARRVALMDYMGDLKDKKVLFLGDDDFTSTITAYDGKAKEVAVADVDADILTGIVTVAKRNGTRISTYQADLRQKLPKQIVGNFDTVFTDPPYTTEGIILFLNQAIKALDPANNSARIYLCFGASDLSKEKFLPVYEAIANSGLMIRMALDKFNRYQGAESVGSASTLFVCEVTPKTRSLHPKNTHSIYTNTK